jgi:hypothetical protein
MILLGLNWIVWCLMAALFVMKWWPFCFHNPNEPNVTVSILIHIQVVLGKISACRPAVLTDGFHYFPASIEANA